MSGASPLWCGEDSQADGWKAEPATWFELIFGSGYFALQREIQYEIGPEYEMFLEMMDAPGDGWLSDE